AAAGGTPPYTWSASGTLPAGLALSPAGVLSGTPTAAGTASFTAQVTDGAAQTASKPLSVTITAPALSITTASPLPARTPRPAYSQPVAAAGGTLPFYW